ncbi:MAG: hypothetical protein H8E13_07610 [Actinobacteria bacterium]|nr:hypothetical protein [Actinomycetota bacterium]
MSAVGLNLSSSKISVIELVGSRKDIIIKNMVKADEYLTVFIDKVIYD